MLLFARRVVPDLPQASPKLFGERQRLAFFPRPAAPAPTSADGCAPRARLRSGGSGGSVSAFPVSAADARAASRASSATRVSASARRRRASGPVVLGGHPAQVQQQRLGLADVSGKVSGTASPVGPCRFRPRSWRSMFPITSSRRSRFVSAARKPQLGLVAPRVQARDAGRLFEQARDVARASR